MLVDINYWAVVVATLSTMVVGSIWYTPKVFGNYWMRVAKVDDSGDRSAVAAIVVTLIVSFISAWVLALATQVAWTALGGNYLFVALITGLVLWAGFTAARFITHDAFEGRPAGLTILNIAHELVTVRRHGAHHRRLAARRHRLTRAPDARTRARAPEPRARQLTSVREQQHPVVDERADRRQQFGRERDWRRPRAAARSPDDGTDRELAVARPDQCGEARVEADHAPEAPALAEQHRGRVLVAGPVVALLGDVAGDHEPRSTERLVVERRLPVMGGEAVGEVAAEAGAGSRRAARAAARCGPGRAARPSTGEADAAASERRSST